jgi:hypothetical protein
LHAFVGFKVTYFLLITVAIFAILWYMPRKQSFSVNLFLYLVMTIAVISTFTVLTLNLERIGMSKKAEDFIAFGLFRDFIKPFLLLLFANIALQYRSPPIMFGTVLAVLVANYGMEQLMLAFGIITFAKWNHAYSLIIESLNLTAAYFFGKWFASLEEGQLERI